MAIQIPVMSSGTQQEQEGGSQQQKIRNVCVNRTAGNTIQQTEQTPFQEVQEDLANAVGNAGQTFKAVQEFQTSINKALHSIKSSSTYAYEDFPLYGDEDICICDTIKELSPGKTLPAKCKLHGTSENQTLSGEVKASQPSYALHRYLSTQSSFHIPLPERLEKRKAIDAMADRALSSNIVKKPKVQDTNDADAIDKDEADDNDEANTESPDPSGK